ncbi:MAG: NUDIX domain-containing protein [Alphaproteobacteria bacterium]
MAEQGKPRGPSVRAVPAGDDRERLVCPDCGFVQYDNPKVVVGLVCAWQDRLLLCKRAINPRRGFWTMPAGYLELNESTIEGARREAWEEARARVEIDDLLAIYSVRRLSQVQIIYRGRLTSPEVTPGPETAEVALVPWREIPWDAIAFPTVRWALRHYDEMRELSGFAARTNPPGESGDLLPSS